VEWVGPDVHDVTVGDRVAVLPGDPNTDGFDIIGNGGSEGGLTDLLLIRDAARGRRLFRVPDQLSLDVAALTEPVAVGMKSALRTDASPGDRVAVFGCGPIGLSAIATLVDRGVEVVGVDLSDRRRPRCHRGARSAVGRRVGRTDPPAWR
jgi:threonine dehydrogenase-like Zn-dependent dehydrogenase